MGRENWWGIKCIFKKYIKNFKIGLKKRETIKLKGIIKFEPEDKTKKHKNQSSWKKIAMVFFDGDICEYYAWFVMKRYNILLNKPLRGAHISFINDSMRDLTYNGERSVKEATDNWEEVKNKWDGKEIEIVLNLDPRTNGTHWWFNIPHEERSLLQSIRTELGLGKPFFGLHLSIGTPRGDLQLEHSNYIHSLLINGLIN
jgi:hypothetical protein